MKTHPFAGPTHILAMPTEVPPLMLPAQHYPKNCLELPLREGLKYLSGFYFCVCTPLWRSIYAISHGDHYNLAQNEKKMKTHVSLTSLKIHNFHIGQECQWQLSKVGFHLTFGRFPLTSFHVSGTGSAWTYPQWIDKQQKKMPVHALFNTKNVWVVVQL